MTQESESCPTNLHEFPSSHSQGTNPTPKLRKFRSLQMVSIAIACVWLVGGSLFSSQFIAHKLNQRLHASQQQLDSEVGYLVRVFEQNLHQAEQLSKTLSFDRSLIEFAHASRQRNGYLGAIERSERVQYLMEAPGVARVNDLFRRMVLHIDAYQVFMLDYWGYCVGSGRSGESDDCIGARYHNREYFQLAASQGSGRQFAVGRLHAVPSFFFSTALHDNEEFVGVIVVRLLTSDAIDFIHPSASVALVGDENGIVIGSSDPTLLFHHVGPALAPLPRIGEYRRLYKQPDMRIMAIEMTAIERGSVSIWTWQGRRHLIGQNSVARNDYHVFLLQDVEAVFETAHGHWGFSITVLLAGILLIVLVERSLNFSQSRKAHLRALSLANENLSQVSNELYELTVTDALTGISSRRYFSQRLEQEVARELRRPQDMPRSSENFMGLSLLLLDIDKFKIVNDTYGHPAGDEAIRSMATICADLVRPSDVVARMGGEEFGILLCDVTPEQTKLIAERILKTCETTEIKFEHHRFSQTCSIGISRLQKGQSADGLLSSVDKALYAAKDQGRNRYVYS